MMHISSEATGSPEACAPAVRSQIGLGVHA